MKLALSCIWEDVRVWVHWNNSFDMHLHHLGPVSVFVFHLEPLQSGRLQWLMTREPLHPVFTDIADDILCAQTIPFLSLLCFPFLYKYLEGHKAECWAGLWRRLSAEELMLLNCGVREDSWESLGLQGDPFWRRSALGFLWKEWC